MVSRVALLVGVLCWGSAAAVFAERPIDFNRDIRPILSENCFQCHGPDEQHRESGLRLDTHDGALADLGGYSAIVAGDAKQSLLVQRVHDVDAPMPPVESKLSLTAAEKELLRRWVTEGAEYAEHWSFVRPERPAVPEGDFGGNPIDAFIGTRLESEGLAFSREAEPETLVRRVTLDLTGLPPTLDEVDEFLADSKRDRERAWSHLVDRLLASPRYGETMALPWLDAARFADTDGYQYDGPRYQWRWRDWVISAYNKNMPFDQFTIEQLAGDLLPQPQLDQLIATGFNRNHRYNSEAGSVVEEFLLENAVDRVDTTSTLWMGLTVGCARCHDHKYDPISQRDYYQLIAYFNSVPEAGRAIKSGNSEPTIVAPTPDQQQVLAEKEAAVAAIRERLQPGDEPQNGGLLIDRRIAHRYALDSLPEKNASVDGEPSFANDVLELDGESTVSLGAQNKALTFRANSSFTIAFWVRPNGQQNSVVLSRQRGGTTRPGVEVALLDDGRLRFDLITRWLAGVGRVTTRQAIGVNEWTHVVISNDGSQSANGQHVYFNGQPAETVVSYNTNSNTGGVDAKRPLVLGGGLRPKSNRFVGAIRDVRVYSTDLWPEEIAILAATYGGPARQEFSRTKMTADYTEYVKLREDLEAYRAKLPTVMVMQDTPDPKETAIRIRGVYNSYGEVVSRNVPEKLPPMPKGYPQNRLGFAKWLVSSEHPLTARVAVNRYWQKYFGTGLVKTAEDFGVQGELPSHPRLLDWLATEFVRLDWDVAAMQKLIVSSRTYRQSSHLTRELYERDSENRLLARGPRLRLSGHAIRDQSLFVSGLLKERVGGPSVYPYQPANMWAEMSMGMKYKQSKGDDLYRRSLYTVWKRTVAPPTMAVFDAADREACWMSRKETNTPLQALTLLNETGFVEAARKLAERMLRKGGDDPIGFAFRSLTSRAPTNRERTVLAAALADAKAEFAADAAAAKLLLATGESTADEAVDTVELAAYTAVANVLLNLDETITRE